jgi:hypothetical protein
MVPIDNGGNDRPDRSSLRAVVGSKENSFVWWISLSRLGLVGRQAFVPDAFA